MAIAVGVFLDSFTFWLSLVISLALFATFRLYGLKEMDEFALGAYILMQAVLVIDVVI